MVEYPACFLIAGVEAAMMIRFSLDASDFLAFQLYTASRSPRIRRRRLLNRFLIPLFFIVMILALFHDRMGWPLALYTAIICLLWVFFYPVFSRGYYRNHYRKHIEDYYKNRVGKEAELEIAEDRLISRDASSEGFVLFTEIDSLVELSAQVLVQFKNGTAGIVPKAGVEPYLLKDFITELEQKTGLKVVNEQGWKWK